jgi:hypothetical protein
MNKLVLPILAFGIIVLVGVAGMVYWNSLNSPKGTAGIVDGGDGLPGLRIENTTDGNWLISVTSGAVSEDSVRMTITNMSTGEKTVDKPVSAFLPKKNNPDALFNDSNGNNRIDAGDTILLKSSSPNIKTGYKVMFLKGENIIGVIGEIH